MAGQRWRGKIKVASSGAEARRSDIQRRYNVASQATQYNKNMSQTINNNNQQQLRSACLPIISHYNMVVSMATTTCQLAKNISK